LVEATVQPIADKTTLSDLLMKPKTVKH
jgi:hypothetical protein